MSLLAPLLKPRTLPATSTITTRSVSACFQTRTHYDRAYRTRRRKDHDNIGERAAPGRRSQQRSVEEVFIQALVTAGSCQHHRPHNPLHSRRPNHQVSFDTRRPSHTSKRHFSSQAKKGQTGVAFAQRPPEPEITRDEYRNLVDTYGSWGTDQVESYNELKSKVTQVAKQHHPLASPLVLTAEQEQPPQRQVLPPENDEHAHNLERFSKLLKGRPGYVNLDELWASYEALQTPRPRYLARNKIKELFWHMTWVEYRHEAGIAERYFSLLNECMQEGVDLTASIWTNAILFAGKMVRNISSDEVKRAIETWMRMEQAGHQADLVTFSVLFQVAVRAGRFGLADTIFNEVKQRGMSLDRMFTINVIYYAGTRRDGDGVRQAFRDLVNAGEIVDTGVMNTVILSLFRAGEFAAAENVFLRMKSLHEQKAGTDAPRDWRAKKETAKLLNSTGKDLRRERERHETSFFGAMFSTEDKREQLQRASPIAPDSRTYQILIKHCVYTSAELAKVKMYVGEMRARELPIHGSVYVHILRGFQAHGGYLSAGWDRGSLEDLWREVLNSMDPVEAGPEVVPPAGQETAPPSSYQPIEPDDFDMLGAMMSDQQSKDPSSTDPAESHPESQTNPDDAKFQEEAFGDLADFESRVHVTKGLALSAINAFYRCAGRSRMLQVWAEILPRWKHGSHEDKIYVQAIVDRLAAEDMLYNV